MKRIFNFILTILAISSLVFAADQRIQFNEKMVGANHPTLSDTLNRLSQIEHDTDGTHKRIATNIRILKAGDSLNSAVATVGSTPTTFLVFGAVLLNGNLTIPSTASLRFEQPGSITKISGTLTINGPFEAGLYQVFSGFSVGDVTFGAGSVHEIYPELWGAKGDATSENATAFSAAIASLPSGGIIRVGYGNYKISSRMNLTSGISIVGSGRNTTNGNSRLNFSSISDIALYINGGSNIEIKNLYVTGQSSGSSNTIQMDGYCRDVIIDDVTINMTGTSTGSGIYITTSLITSTIRNVRTVGGNYGFWIGSDSTSITLERCYPQSTAESGYLIQGTYISLISCAADNNTKYGYIIQNASQIGMYSCGAEANGRSGLYVMSTNGFTIDCFRSHGNNTALVSTKYPSAILLYETVRNVIISNPRDTSPTATTEYSIACYDTGANAYKTLTYSGSVKIIHPSLLALGLQPNLNLQKKGTTAQRPSLGVDDAGYDYLDTTLDADGKPIWWNGTAWVDATGATV